MTAVPEPARESREVFRKHHPGLLQSDEQVIGQFAVRQPELEIVLDILRGNLDSPSCQHALILGPRGQGKSTLLARVAAEIRTNPEFAPRLLPVRFTDESAEVFDAASFWLETLFHVAREVEASQPEIAAELRATRADVIRRWQDASLEESARAAVLAASERMDRRLVLMVENLHVLFGTPERGLRVEATGLASVGAAHHPARDCNHPLCGDRRRTGAVLRTLPHHQPGFAEHGGLSATLGACFRGVPGRTGHPAPRNPHRGQPAAPGDPGAVCGALVLTRADGTTSRPD